MENIRVLINFVFWILLYTFIFSFSQVLLKLGLNQIGTISLKTAQEILPLALNIVMNPYVLSGMILLSSSFFIWLAILSWFKLSLALPLVSLSYVLVALLGFFMLDEKLSFINYFGIILITAGVFFVVCK